MTVAPVTLMFAGATGLALGSFAVTTGIRFSVRMGRPLARPAATTAGAV